MRRVPDIVLPVPIHIGAVPDVQNAENETGNGNGDEKKANSDGRIEHDACKQHSGSRSRSTYGTIALIVFMLVVRTRRDHNDGKKIKKQINTQRKKKL